ncbi:hypothetical protein [Amphibacillus sediminis]|uniref:hypothetical protein n=1 Tax=Amphibacillus sediminis TaxID=360185 RepID=UPI00082D0D99|nr:hypothetical protein [Amphibacillus sediminis]
MRLSNFLKFCFATLLLLSATGFMAVNPVLADALIEPFEFEADLKQFEFEINDQEIEASFSDTELKTDRNEEITLEDNRMSTSSSYLIDSDRFIYSDSLTESDPDDWWFFSVDSDRSILFQLDSAISDYYVQLYLIDWSTGTAYPTALGGQAGQTIAHSSLPEGDWALRVFSEGTVGDAYTLRMNASNPEGASGVISSSTSLQYLVLSYPNGDIYVNGSYLANQTGNNSHLDWERVFMFSWDGNYNQRTHSISSVKIRNISAPVSYQSNYAKSDNAIMLYLDIDTLFMHHESYFRSGPPTQYESSFVDTLGKVTPRRLDQDDLTNWGDHILIYDLNTNKSIDFFSVLNFYYASGAEPIPTITYLN